MSNRVEDGLQYDDIVERIYQDPRFKSMVSQKQRFSLLLLSLTLGLYILIILAVAFAPNLMGLPIAGKMITTWGIPAGFFLIIWTIIMTGYYVHKTNNYYDPMTEKLLKEIANELK